VNTLDQGHYFINKRGFGFDDEQAFPVRVKLTLPPEAGADIGDNIDAGCLFLPEQGIGDAGCLFITAGDKDDYVGVLLLWWSVSSSIVLTGLASIFLASA